MGAVAIKQALMVRRNRAKSVSAVFITPDNPAQVAQLEEAEGELDAISKRWIGRKRI